MGRAGCDDQAVEIHPNIAELYRKKLSARSNHNAVNMIG